MASRYGSRPLLLAGPAAVAGVLLAAADPLWPAAALLAATGWAGWRRDGSAVLLLAALAAGLAQGARLQQRTEFALAAAGNAWPRAPPRAGQAELTVVRCDEEPLRNRAWLEGRDSEGIGVLCAWDGALPDGIASGGRVRVAGRFSVPRAPTNPGEFDSRRAFAQRGISLRAELRTPENIEPLTRPSSGWRRRVATMRGAAAERLATALPDDVAPLACALLLGLRSGIAEEDRALFERTGTMHILAISGMHIVLLAGALHALLRRLGVGPRTAATLTLLLALAYLPLTGAATPIRRAVAMLAFYGIAVVRGRPPDSASALGGAALLLSLTDPAEVYRIGFRLSFLAAAGIAWLAPPLHEAWSRRYRLLRRFPAVQRDYRIRLALSGYVLRALPVALAAWATTQAWVAFEFGVATPLAPLSNLLAGPILGLLLPLVALLGLGATFLAGPVTMLVRALRALLEACASVPGGFWSITSPPLWAVLLWTAGCFLLRGRPRAGVALLLLACAGITRGTPASARELVLVDVGHGQSCLLRDPEAGTVMVDGGSRRPAGGRRLILPALKALGITRLEAVVCTHADSDHWNGVPRILAGLPVGRVVTGGAPPPELVAAAHRYGVPLVRARPGDVLWNGLRVLAGDGGDNDRSLALLWECGARRVLLPADREEAGLDELVAAGLPACDVLVAPHHGARCASAGAFGHAVRPRLMLVSTAAGFAHADTLAAYGAGQTIATPDAGCIRVRIDDLAVTTWAGGKRATIRAP